MKKIVYLLAAASAFIATPALAQTSVTVTAGTDYVSRGTSQTDGGPAVGVYAEHQFDNGFYVAGFVSNVDFLDSTDIEADLFAGHRGTLVEGVSYDVGLALITYHGGTRPDPVFNPSGNWNMVEAKLNVSHTTGALTIGGTVAVTPDYFNNYGPSVWTEVTASYAITDRLSVSGAVGRQQFFEASEGGFPSEISDYNTFNVGASYAITPTLTADVRYYDNDTSEATAPTIYGPISPINGIYEPRVVLSLRKVF